MGLVTSWLVFVVGAILQFGVSTDLGYLNEVGVVLIILGALGFVLSLIFWESWGGFKSSRQQRIAVQKDSEARNGEGRLPVSDA
ncbi:MAG TPA: hypothetical protein VNG12_04525 [Acidimicrobiales bacterium]|nr:hypothetical protein [Acidimicrobiales bacterium]